MSTEHDDRGGLVTGTMRRLVGTEGLRRRVEALERELEETKQLTQRVAELTDIVQELLVPLAQGDPERAAELIDRYRDELGS